jgi:hypothetical protein
VAPQIFVGIFFIALGLATTLFARKIVDYCVRTDSKRMIRMRFDLNPSFAPISLWVIRFGGIFCVFCGLMLVINTR